LLPGAPLETCEILLVEDEPVQALDLTRSLGLAERHIAQTWESITGPRGAV
jgi:hypothetical protein